MKHTRLAVTGLAIVFGFAVTVSAQEAPPREPFKAVHLVNITSPADVAPLQATIADLNAAVASAGLRETRYRLYKVAGKQAGSHVGPVSIETNR